MEEHLNYLFLFFEKGIKSRVRKSFGVTALVRWGLAKGRKTR